MNIVRAFTLYSVWARPSVGSRSPQDPIVISFCPTGISYEPSSQYSSLPLTCSGFEYERGASEMLGCISHRSLLYCQGLSVWGIVPALTTTGEAGALGDHCNVGLVDKTCCWAPEQNPVTNTNSSLIPIQSNQHMWLLSPMK